ncbi:putative glucan endo-1,3-beta-glucosidase btgC [Amylocarpus encephaloides]|uniref:glucan endo-1,3-beta-D-glucosidase n=1 Tax=Amylocarpus encephaloides TaxID=45428 RepID=A0A9P7YE43_9HELO|nr:putative glucan endo-1,3-beta-glucosidase btgC [Amylocarpus encephaloides]
MRNTPGYDPQREMHHYDEQHGYPQQSPYHRPEPRQDMSASSLTPLGAAAFPPGLATPQNSMLSLGHQSHDRALPGAVAGGAAAGGIMGTLGGLVGKGGNKSTAYNPVVPAADYNLGQEKSEWLSKQKTGGKKLRWLVIAIVALAISGAIAGGIVGGILGSKNSKNQSSSSSGSPSGASAAEDNKENGDLSKDSTEIKALLNNKNLHKVFPGIDYTPMYTQYPDCVHYPPSQNNVTRDVAVLSQLSNTIRLYGTDCNQTQMVLHAIDRLGLNGTTKVWMGVWQDGNATTNARQLQQMYDIFDSHGSASFAGVIVGNEVLFRKEMSITQLGTILTQVKTNLTARNIHIPIASSDLGDNWTKGFADQVDILMANIHPFFAGESSTDAAAWTWQFWQNKDVPLKTDLTKNYIAETGWPSQGGKTCGEATTCAVGSVAGITEMNNFMNSWVCQALTNGTNYFWFEAFDEPWKIKFNTPGKEWEDQWGLMDVNRSLKPGVVIPSCGGKTAP